MNDTARAASADLIVSNALWNVAMCGAIGRIALMR
jgi:hypothetical protein